MLLLEDGVELFECRIVLAEMSSAMREGGMDQVDQVARRTRIRWAAESWVVRTSCSRAKSPPGPPVGKLLLQTRSESTKNTSGTS